MPRFTTVIDSELPVEEAFGRMVAFERVTEWDPATVEASRVAGEAGAAGARFRVVTRFAGRTVTLEYELVDSDPPRSFAVEARNPSFRARDTIGVAPRGKGSAVTYDALIELRGARRLLGPVLQLVFTRIGRHAEKGLRRFLRADASVAEPGTIE